MVKAESKILLLKIGLGSASFRLRAACYAAQVGPPKTSPKTLLGGQLSHRLHCTSRVHETAWLGVVEFRFIR
jgi:hypothetical protein